MSVAVVYLSRKAEGASPTLAFLDAYKAKPAGLDHDLFIVAKGYPEQGFFIPEISVISAPDEGFDIGTYRYAVRQLRDEYDLVCFLNSYSRPLVEGWLAKLLDPFKRYGMAVGLVGCTGSHEGISTSPFPNMHVRTNAFAMRRLHFLAMHFPDCPTREDCLQFEAGPYSLTNRMLGLRVMVVGAGGARDLVDARETNTFRWSNQCGLLVGDNRTDEYQHASKETRAWFERNAWGMEET